MPASSKEAFESKVTEAIAALAQSRVVAPDAASSKALQKGKLRTFNPQKSVDAGKKAASHKTRLCESFNCASCTPSSIVHRDCHYHDHLSTIERFDRSWAQSQMPQLVTRVESTTGTPP